MAASPCSPGAAGPLAPAPVWTERSPAMPRWAPARMSICRGAAAAGAAAHNGPAMTLAKDAAVVSGKATGQR